MKQVDRVVTLEELGFLKPGITVADIGCGCGNWPMTFVERNHDVEYIGLDVSKSALHVVEGRLKWTKLHYKLYHINCKNKCYAPKNKFDAKDAKFPMKDKSVDLVICHSLFTHLATEAVAINYMNEIKRVLKEGGKLWITFFTSPPNDVRESTLRTVYKKEFVESLLDGFNVVHLENGLSTEYHDQMEVGCEYFPKNFQ